MLGDQATQKGHERCNLLLDREHHLRFVYWLDSLCLISSLPSGSLLFRNQRQNIRHLRGRCTCQRMELVEWRIMHRENKPIWCRRRCMSIDDAMKLPSAPMRTYVQFEFVLYNRVNRLLVLKQIVSKGFHFRPFTSLQYICIFEKCHFWSRLWEHSFSKSFSVFSCKRKVQCN